MVSNNKGDCGREDGVDATTMMNKWMKERAKAPKWISSNNEAFGRAGGVRSRRKECVPFQPMLSATTNTCSTSRKRAGLHGMVAEDSDAVDPATVPMKLRSAINKRSNQLSSSAAPDGKKRHHHLTTNRLRVLDENGRGRYKESLMFGSLTQDEEDVLEALCALSGMLPKGEQFLEREFTRKKNLEREDGRVLKNPLDKHATLAADSGLKEEKHLLLECTAGGIKNPSSCAENQLGETMKDEHACFQQPITDYRMQKIDSNLNKTSKSGTHATLLSENKNPGGSNLSCHSQYFPRLSGNRVLHTTKCKAVVAVPSCKPDMPRPNGCIASAAPTHEVQQLKHSRTIPPPVHSASSNSTRKSGSMYGAAKFLSSTVDRATEKIAAGMGSSWKKCVIHVSISHLIKDDQAKEKQLGILPSSVPANNEKTWLQRDEMNAQKCASPDGSFVDSNKCEGRNEASCKKRFMPFHLPTILSEARQKQTGDFLSSSSPGCGPSGSANAVKSSRQLRFPFLHAQVPQHSAVPFPFTRAPYAPPYTEKVDAATFQQSQLQVAWLAPGKMPSHTQQQFTQQHIWHAHFAHSTRPLAGAAATLQHERPSASFMSQNAHHRATFSPATSIRMQGGPYQSPLSWQERQLINHPSSNLSSSNHRHPPGSSLYGSRFHHEGNQLQLLCNTTRP